MKKIIVTILMLNSLLLSTTFTINPGWNLLGTSKSLPVSDILANTNIKNVVIYQNGEYKASNKNEITTIPEKSGFFADQIRAINKQINLKDS